MEQSKFGDDTRTEQKSYSKFHSKQCQTVFNNDNFQEQESSRGQRLLQQKGFNKNYTKSNGKNGRLNSIRAVRTLAAYNYL